MPFGVKSMSELRSSLVEEIKSGERSISAICRDYNVSRVTAYKWLNRRDSGISMEDLSRAPLIIPNRTSQVVEDLIIQARQEHPCWGGRKLKAYLERRGEICIPSASTVTAILHRHGLISKEASLAATPFKRFERENPNDLWQTDFKGHFMMLDGNRCHPLTVTDDMSRFNLCISAKDNERLPGVVESFLLLFKKYGLPLAILCDNGKPWGTGSYFGGYTNFEVLLMDFGILPIHGRPWHPQTQGKEERFHGTLKRELLMREKIKDLSNAQKRFDAFRKEYNEVRPHCALNYDVPADKYKKSDRIMPPKISQWEYPQNLDVRYVTKGYVMFKNQKFYLSYAFEGKTVALRESQKDGIIDIIYRNFSLARINARERSMVSKKINRLKQNDME